MTDFEIYVFILCLLVFVLLTGMFSYLIVVMLKQQLRLIRAGLEDTAIIKAYQQEKAKKTIFKVLESFVSLVICAVLLVAFLFSAYVKLREDTYVPGMPTLKVVSSSSMASKYEKNTYLFAHHLDDQVQLYDLLVTYPVPAEEDLKLYDIVIYEIEGQMVLHRIVGIEEPGVEHPDQRYFLCQGDALERPDRFPVLYSQIRGIYRGEKIPLAGNFVLFMQSPAGWLCILLTVFVIFVTPVMEKKLRTEEKKRLKQIGYLEEEVREASEKRVAT